MSDYNDELMRYEEAAEDQYDDFDNEKCTMTKKTTSILDLKD